MHRRDIDWAEIEEVGITITRSLNAPFANAEVWAKQRQTRFGGVAFLANEPLDRDGWDALCDRLRSEVLPRHPHLEVGRVVIRTADD